MAIPKLGKMRNKIFRVMFAVGFIPIVALGLLSFYNIRVLHNSDVASIEKNLINQKIEEIDAFIQSIQSTFQLKVSFEQVSDIELSSQHFILRRLLDEFPEIQEISFINIRGYETSRANRSFPDGVPTEELQNIKTSEKFIKARESQDYISPIYLKSGPTVTISAPVYNRNGVIISVLTGDVGLETIQKIVEKSQLGKIGYLYVVARDGFLVAHSQKDKINSPNLAYIDFVKSTVGSSPETTNESRYLSAWDETVVASGRYLENLSIGVIAEWPIKEADQILNTLNKQFFTTSLLVLAGTIIFSVLVASRIVKPIKTLEAGTHLIAEGKFDQPILIKTKDEIEDLGNAFNDMALGLKRLEELKKEFVFIAAHELRTPVAIIKGYLSLIIDGNFGEINPQVKDTMLKTFNANQRLVQLVNDLLEIARAEAGKLTIRIAAIDISEPMSSIIKEMQILANEKSINLIYESMSSAPKIMADADRLKEIMTNLIGNAIKYMTSAGTIIISHEIAGNEFVTHVKDTGLGISKKDQEKLFEKFYRVQTEKTRDISGTGLGLFIVKQIVEKMGGKIWVKSEEGKGSTFSFSLTIS